MILLLYSAPASDISSTSYAYAAAAAAAAGWRKQLITFKGKGKGTGPSLPHLLHPLALLCLTTILNKTATTTNSMKRNSRAAATNKPQRWTPSRRTSTPPRRSIPSKAPSPNSGGSIIGERYYCAIPILISSITFS